MSRDPSAILPSHGQRALWFLERLRPGSAAYMIAGAARVRGALDRAALGRAAAALAARHPQLRATFHDGGANPEVRIGTEPLVEFTDIIRITGASIGGIAVGLQETAFRPFDLERGPLLRLGLLHAGAAATPLWCWRSTTSLRTSGRWACWCASWGRSTAKRWGAGAGGSRAARLTYGDWARRQERRWPGREGERTVGLLARALAGVPPVPRAAGRPAAPAVPERPRRRACALRPVRRGADALRALAAPARRDALHGPAGRLPGAARPLDRPGRALRSARRPPAGAMPELAGLVGYFVNPVAMRGEPLGRAAISRALLDRARAAALGAFEHQDFPFRCSPSACSPSATRRGRRCSRRCLVLQKGRPRGGGRPRRLRRRRAGGGDRLRPGGPGVAGARRPRRAVRLDSSPRRDRAAGSPAAWSYNRDLFDRRPRCVSPGAGRPAHWRSPRTRPVSRPAAAGAAAAGRGRAPPAAVGVERRRPGRGCRRRIGPGAVRGAGGRQPGAPAVVSGGGSLTYGELDRRAAALAGVLRRAAWGRERGRALPGALAGAGGRRLSRLRRRAPPTCRSTPPSPPSAWPACSRTPARPRAHRAGEPGGDVAGIGGIGGGLRGCPHARPARAGGLAAGGGRGRRRSRRSSRRQRPGLRDLHLGLDRPAQGRRARPARPARPGRLAARGVSG